MQVMAKSKANSELESKKHKTVDWRKYWQPNIDRFYRYNKMLFDTTLSQDEITSLKNQMKPQLEFNIMKPFLMRQLGEFLRQEPGISVRASDCAKQIDPMLIKVIEGHIVCSMFESNQSNDMYKIAMDMYSAGFGVMEVFTDYKNERSFEQIIGFKSADDPAMCVFDPFSRKPHKGDGDYCGKIIPYKKEVVEETWGEKYTKNIRFSNDLSGFKWAYRSGDQAFILVQEMYYKVKKKAKIVLTTDNQTMTTDEYDEFVEKWNADPNNVAQAPGIVGGKSRNGFIETIKRSIFTGDHIMEDNEDTDFKYLPYLMFLGQSRMIRDTTMSAMQEITNSYIKDLEGLQRLTNYSGNTIANDIENMIQHKLMMPKDGIPAEYADAYSNFQIPSIVIYNQYKENDVNVPLNKPEVIPRVPLPQEVMAMFTGANSVAQMIMGSYDASLGISDKQLSGEAIQSGAMMSNAASMPFMAGYLAGVNRLAEHYLSLIPKLYVTPRTIPIRDGNGKRQYLEINGDGGVKLEYDSDSLEVRVEAGVNFEIQRERAFNMLQGIMKITPVLNDYIGSTEQGIEMLLDNIDMRSIDNLRQGIKPYLQQKQQQSAQAAQQQMMMNPMVLKQQELKLKSQQMENETVIESAKVNVNQEKEATSRMIALAKIGEMTDNTTLRANEIQAENARTTVQAATQMADMNHGHAMDLLNLHHEKETRDKNMQVMAHNTEPEVKIEAKGVKKRAR